MTEFKAPETISEATRALNEALAKAQDAFGPISKERQGGGGSKTYRYADLADILKVCRKPLAENGLSIVQLLESNGTGPALRTELRHSGGAVLGSSFPFSAPEDPQDLGSLLTYLRRYAITALLGIAAEEDDDGQRAKGGKGKAAEKSKAPKPIEEAQRGQIDAMLRELIEKAPQAEGQLSWPAQLRERFKVQTKEELTQAQAFDAIGWLKIQLENEGIPF